MSGKKENQEERQYDRQILIETLWFHHRLAESGCVCGWFNGHSSHAVHLADEYEQALDHKDLKPAQVVRNIDQAKVLRKERDVPTLGTW